MYKYKRLAPGEYLYDETDGYTRQGLRITIDRIDIGGNTYWHAFPIRYHQDVYDNWYSTLVNGANYSLTLTEAKAKVEEKI
jgi:hypothetical protein